MVKILIALGGNAIKQSNEAGSKEEVFFFMQLIFY
jgi:carbamate kinase